MLNFDKINELIEGGYIYKRVHSSGRLYIYNYTEKTQYENFWTPETLQCRGLICNHKNEIIARPFSKFFNLVDYKGQLPNESFEIYEKLDGSLGILYFYDGKPFIATRGAFDSKQAYEAQEMLYTIYNEAISFLNKDCTYLFEIIYPSNRIVVNYGDMKCLVLLGVINTNTGEELSLHEFDGLGFPLAQKYNWCEKVDELYNLNESNKEGFVVRFANGFRAKVKLAEYVKLHSFISSVSKKKIWELLRDQIPFDNLLHRIPDECYNWVKNTINEINDEYKQIEEESKEALFDILNKVTDRNNRKELASYITTSKYPSVLFPMLDKKDYSKYIWKLIEPTYEVPVFSQTE